jgi:hypothetical protein
MVGIIKELKMQEVNTRGNVILYLLSSLLWLLTVFFNLSKLFYNPSLFNGIMLEVGIICLIGCSYLSIINKKKLDKIKEKELEIKIVKKVRKSYI